jgi:hypothetical protein
MSDQKLQDGDAFDVNLRKQNEIIHSGWHLQRFSYHQLMDPKLRNVVMVLSIKLYKFVLAFLSKYQNRKPNNL